MMQAATQHPVGDKRNQRKMLDKTSDHSKALSGQALQVFYYSQNFQSGQC